MDNIILNNVKTALKGLDIELKCHDGLYEFDYREIPLFLTFDNGTQSVAFLTMVADLGNGKLNKDSLEKAFHEVECYYNHCHADWCDGDPYFASPHFPVKEDGMATPEWMEEILKDFCHSYFFLLDLIYDFSGMVDTEEEEEDDDSPSSEGMPDDNACEAHHRQSSALACDTPADGENGKGGDATEHLLMDRGELKVMVMNDFTDFHCFDLDNIGEACEDYDFIDGCRIPCPREMLAACLTKAIEDLRNAHSPSTMTMLAVKISANTDQGLTRDDMEALNKALSSPDVEEMQWGLEVKDELPVGTAAVCVAAGFKHF